jgi:hypothetical protein
VPPKDIDLIRTKAISCPDELINVANLITALAQVKPITSVVLGGKMMQIDPLLAGLQNIFRNIFDKGDCVYEMNENPIKHHLQHTHNAFDMYKNLIQKLLKENS